MGDDAVVALSISQFFRNQCVYAVALLRGRWCARLSAVRLEPARWLLRDTSRWSVAAFCPDNGVWRSFAGTISDRLGPRLLLTVGPIIAACGLAMFAFVDLRWPYWVGVFPPTFLLGIGMAITVPPLTSTVIAAAGKGHAGIASGVNNAGARVAGLLAVAALGTVFFASFSYHLPGMTAAQANEVLNAVMSGQPDVN